MEARPVPSIGTRSRRSRKHYTPHGSQAPFILLTRSCHWCSVPHTSIADVCMDVLLHEYSSDWGHESSGNMNQKAVTNTISQLQFKGDVFTRQLIIEQRRIEDINTVRFLSNADPCTCRATESDHRKVHVVRVQDGRNYLYRRTQRAHRRSRPTCGCIGLSDIISMASRKDELPIQLPFPPRHCHSLARVQQRGDSGIRTVHNLPRERDTAWIEMFGMYCSKSTKRNS